MRPIVGSFLIGCALSLSATLSNAADSIVPLKIGDFPPVYVGRPLGGDDLKIDPSDGRAHVISFWASWCGPCLQELPVLANIQKIAGADKIKVILINIEERDVYRRLQSQISELGLVSTFDPNKQARKAYGVDGVPHMVIVGRDGKITSVRVGYSQAKLEELSQELNRAIAVPSANPNK